MLDVSDTITIKGNKFLLTEKIAPGKSVKFDTIWKKKLWHFQGDVADDGTTVHLTCIGSL